MQIRHLILVLFLAVMALPGVARSEKVDIDPNVQACRSDNNCVLVGSGCMITAVNEKYNTRATKMANNLNKEIDCEEVEGADPKKAQAYCSFPIVECKNPLDRKNYKRCYDNEGQCKVRY